MYEEEYLSKLNNVVDNDSVKKTVYDKLATKINVIDICGFFLKTHCSTSKSSLEKNWWGK